MLPLFYRFVFAPCKGLAVSYSFKFSCCVFLEKVIFSDNVTSTVAHFSYPTLSLIITLYQQSLEDKTDKICLSLKSFKLGGLCARKEEEPVTLPVVRC